MTDFVTDTEFQISKISPNVLFIRLSHTLNQDKNVDPDTPAISKYANNSID